MRNTNKNNKIRVVCAMSGGVDSAVSAALLKKAGFAVEGVFVRLADGKSEDEVRAKMTAQKLQIPFAVWDLRQDFKKIVVDKFIAEIKSGSTPNPCAVCNPEIKFGLFLEKAMAGGADFMATGHYCQIKKTKDGIFHLLKGKDKNKDQTYFLWRLTQKQLAKIIFPVGVFEKDEIRSLAKKWRLSAAAKESQEACFAGGDAAGFIERRCGQNPGDIVDGKGNILGRHDGLWFYTIGQRQGIKLGGGPFYVAGKNFDKNRLVVSKNKSETEKKEIVLRDINWLAVKEPDLPITIKVKIRYRAKDAAATLDKIGGRYILNFTKPQFAPAPGQSAVFYRGNELLGGGRIVMSNE